MKRDLKLGTRKSALAWAQSSWVAREIEAANPEVSVQLVGMETQGDRITDVPLHKIEGKEFFSAELDQALLEGRVDLTVHSLKDLSLERPKGIVLAAIPVRENPRDIILYAPDVIEKIESAKSLKVGTSSPRRQENLPPFLSKMLPSKTAHPFEILELRGNVDTRISRLFEDENSPRKLDAVVLAMAGLCRLWRDEHARGKIENWINAVRWMVVPLDYSPSAPGQGALAIECRQGESEVQAFIRKIHDSETARLVETERQILQEWGGGCHQRFGATSVAIPDEGRLLMIRGKRSNGQVVDERRWSPDRRLPKLNVSTYWDGTAVERSDSSWARMDSDLKISTQEAVFIAHHRALPDGCENLLRGSHVWVSGTATWAKLARRGVWVEGCAESLGFESISDLLSEPLLRLPQKTDWHILTHLQGVGGWKGFRCHATYQLKPNESEPKNLKNAEACFWSSGSQFEHWGSLAHSDAWHSCGPGKTAQFLKARGVKNLIVFPSVKEWRSWLGIKA